ncbi:MAG: hypothetical protein QM743_04125 [Chitinophagaceae bacterium]
MIKQTLQLTAACMLVMLHNTQAQSCTFGIDGGLNRSTQLFFDPQHPKDGTTQLNGYTGWHAGVFATADHLFRNKVLDFFTYRARLSYFKKGAVQPAQISDPFYPVAANGISQIPKVDDVRIKNTLDYISLDLTFQKHLLHFGHTSSLYLEAGLGNNVLVRSDIKAGAIDPVRFSPPYNEYNDGRLRRYNLTWIAGAGINLENKYSIYAQCNKGITAVYHSNTLRVRDWSWTIGAGITIGSAKTSLKS